MLSVFDVCSCCLHCVDAIYLIQNVVVIIDLGMVLDRPSVRRITSNDSITKRVCGLLH